MSVTKSFVSVSAMMPDERIRVFRSSFSAPAEDESVEVDAYAIITSRFLVIGDTLLCPEHMEAMLNEMQKIAPGRQLLIINSHADWDHVWGNCYFTGQHSAPIIAHEHCRTRMLSTGAQTELAAYKQRHSLFKNVVLAPPTVTFTAGLTIYGGDLTLKLFSAPGHHADHIAIWIPELSLLLAFDAAEKPLPLIESPASIFSTWERFVALGPQHVLCAHGKTTSIDIVEKNRAYLRKIEQRCRTLLETRQPDTQELEHASDLIHYPFDEAIVDIHEPVDRTFYSWVHDNNVRNVLQWLMGE